MYFLDISTEKPVTVTNSTVISTTSTHAALLKGLGLLGQMTSSKSEIENGQDETEASSSVRKQKNSQLVIQNTWEST
jgi:hypothetical protein